MKRKIVPKGFSLVEFMIYFMIFSAVAILLVNLFVSTARGRGQVQSRAEVQQNLRAAVLSMTQAIHRATGVSGTPGATLCLTMTDTSKNPTQFDLSSTVARIAEGSGGGACPPSGTPQALTGDKVEVTGLTFTQIANPAPAKPTIKIDITIKYKDNGNPQLVYSQNLITSVALKQ